MFVDSFWALLICRAIPAFFHPIYIALALSMATRLSQNKQEALKATARVFAGISAGMVLGVPIASFFWEGIIPLLLLWGFSPFAQALHLLLPYFSCQI